MYPGHWAKITPDKPAVVMAGTDDVVTYRQLDERSTRLARLWHDAGLRPGDSVALFMENQPRYLEIVWAALRSGLRVTPVNRYLTTAEAKKLDFHAIPLPDLDHLPQYGGRSPKLILYALIIVGLFLALASCINFINVATAHALKRSKEVGVRKAMGSSRWQLIGQFMVETTLVTLAAVLLAMLLVFFCFVLTILILQRGLNASPGAAAEAAPHELTLEASRVKIPWPDKPYIRVTNSFGSTTLYRTLAPAADAPARTIVKALQAATTRPTTKPSTTQPTLVSAPAAKGA